MAVLKNPVNIRFTLFRQSNAKDVNEQWAISSKVQKAKIPNSFQSISRQGTCTTLKQRDENSNMNMKSRQEYLT